LSLKIPPLWGLTPLLHRELIDPVVRVNYNRNAGLVLDADLALLIVDAGISVRMQSCSDSHLKRDTGFLRPHVWSGRQVAQTHAWHGMQSYSDSRWMGRSYSDSRWTWVYL